MTGRQVVRHRCVPQDDLRLAGRERDYLNLPDDPTLFDSKSRDDDSLAVREQGGENEIGVIARRVDPHNRLGRSA